MTITATQISNIYKQCRSQSDLGEGLRWGFVKKGNGFIDATSWEGRFRRFTLGKGCYPTAKEALDLVAASLLHVDIQDEKTARALIELKERIDPPTKAKSHKLSEKLEQLERERIVDPFADSELFSENSDGPLSAEEAFDMSLEGWMARFERVGQATSDKARLSQLNRMHEWDSKLKHTLTSSTVEERPRKIREAAEELRQRAVTTDETWMLQGSAGRAGFSLPLLLEGLKKAGVKELLLSQSGNNPLVEKILSSADPCQTLAAMFREHLEEFEKLMPQLSEREERIVSQVMDLLTENESRSIDLKVPSFIGHEINALYKNGLLESLMAFLSPELQSVLEVAQIGAVPFSHFDPNSPASKKAIELSTALISSLLGYSSARSERFLQTHFESLIDSLPHQLLERTGCEELFTRSPIYYTFQRNEAGTYTISVHAVGAAFQKHHGGGFPVKITSVKEEKLTSSFFERLLSHHFAPEFDSTLISDPSQLYRTLFEELEGKVERIQRKPPQNRSQLSEMLLCNNPDDFNEIDSESLYHSWRRAVEPYIDREAKSIGEIPSATLNKLRNAASALCKQCQQDPIQKKTVEQFLALTTPLAGVKVESRLTELLQRLSLSKELIRDYRETVLWLFGQEFEENLRFIESLLPEKEIRKSVPVAKAPVKVKTANVIKRPQRSLLIRFLSSSAFQSIVWLIRFNLQVASLLKSINSSLVTAGSSLLQMRLVGAFLSEIVPLGIVEWIHELSLQLTKWALTLMLKILVTRIMPSDLRQQLESSFDDYRSFAHKLLNKAQGIESLSYSVNDFELPHPVIERIIRRAENEKTSDALPSFKRIQTAFVYESLEGKSEEEIIQYLEDTLQVLKQSRPDHPMEMEPFFKALGTPRHGERSIGDSIQNKEKFIDLLMEIGESIPGIDKEPWTVLFMHQLMAHVDRIVTSEEKDFVLAYNESLRSKTLSIYPHESKLTLMRAPQLIKYFAENQLALKSGPEQRLYRELMEYFYPEVSLSNLFGNQSAVESLLYLSPLESYLGRFYSEDDSVSARIADYILGNREEIKINESHFQQIVSSSHPEDAAHPFFKLLENRYGRSPLLAIEDLLRVHSTPLYVPKSLNRLAIMQTCAMNWKERYLNAESEESAIQIAMDERQIKKGWNISGNILHFASFGSFGLENSGIEPIELIYPSYGYVRRTFCNTISGLSESRPSDADVYQGNREGGDPHLTDAEILLTNHQQDAALRAMEILRKSPKEILNKHFTQTLEALFSAPGLMTESIKAAPELGSAVIDWALFMVRHFKENGEFDSLRPLLKLLILYKTFIEGEHEESLSGLFKTLLPEIESIDQMSAFDKGMLQRDLVSLLPLNPNEEDMELALPFYKKIRPFLYHWNTSDPRTYRVISRWDRMLPDELIAEQPKKLPPVEIAPVSIKKAMPARKGVIPLSSISQHGLAYLERLTSASDILVGVEEGNSEITSLSLFADTIHFDIVNGKAVGRDAFRGEEIVEKQFHPALQGFSSYLLLKSPAGKMRALIPAHAFSGSLLHRLLVHLGPLEPFVQGIIRDYVGELVKSQTVISLEITSSGELVANDAASIELLLTHRLLQGNYGEANKLYAQLESLARRKPLSMHSEMLATIATAIPTKEIEARTLRLKLIALTYENSLLQNGKEAPKERFEYPFLLSLLATDLKMLKKDGLSLSPRQEWLLYEKLFDVGSKAIGSEWFSSLYSEMLPGEMRDRYRELRDKFRMDSCWIERVRDTASFLSSLEGEENPLPSRQQMVALARKGLDKLLPSYKSFELSDIMRPLLLLTPIWDSPLFICYEYIQDNEPCAATPGSPLNEKSFWPLYRLAFGEERESLKEWIGAHSGIGTVEELAMLELLKTALAHPYIMPSPEILLAREHYGSFRGDLFVPFAIAKLSDSAVGCLKNQLVKRGREWLLNKIPDPASLINPSPSSGMTSILEAALTRGVDAFVAKNTMRTAPVPFVPDETEHRKALLACERKWGAPLEAMGKALFTTEEFPEVVLKEIRGSEGTRLKKSMDAHQQKKKLFRLKHPGDLYRAYFGLKTIEEELQGEILGREARLKSFLQNTVGKNLTLNQWQQGLLNGKCEKLLRKSGFSSEEIQEVKQELEMLLLMQVEIMRYRRALSAFRSLQEGGGEEAIAKILAGELNQPHLIELEKWPDWLIQKSLLIERENNFLLWEKQVSIIEELLTAEDDRIAIEAIPGIGKSAVLKQIIEEMRMRKGLGVFTVVPSPLIGECARYNSEQAARISGKGDTTLNLFNPELYTNPKAMKLLYATVQDAISSNEGINLTRQDLSYMQVRLIESLIKPSSMPAECRRYLRKLLDLVNEKVTLIVDEPQIVFYYRDLFITPIGGKRQLNRQLVADTEEAIAALASHPLIQKHISSNSLPTLSKESYSEVLSEVVDDLLGDSALLITTTALGDEAALFLTDPTHEASSELLSHPSFSRLSLYRGVFTDLFPRLMQQNVSVNFGIGKEGYARPFSGNMDCKEKSTSRQPLETLIRTFVSYYNHGLSREQKEETLKTLEVLQEKKLLAEVKEASLNSRKLIGAYVRFIAAPRIPYFAETIEHTAADMVSMFKNGSYTAMTGTIYSEGSYPGDKKVLWSDETLGEAISILQEKCSGIYILDAESPQEILTETLMNHFKDGSSTALIDGGAKLIGMKSLEVAERMRAFAKIHAPHIQGIRFFAKDASGTNQLMFLGVDANEAVPASQVNVPNSAVWTYYSDLEGTGANVPQANLAGVVLVSEKIGSTGTTLASQIQYCFRMRGILNEGASVAVKDQPFVSSTQSIRFVMTKSAKEILFADDVPTPPLQLAFNQKNEEMSVKEECFFSRPQQMRAVIRGPLMKKITQASSEDEAEMLANRGREFLTSAVEMDPAKLWGGSIIEKDPHTVFSAYKDALLHKAKACGLFSEEEIALFDKELTELALGKNLNLPEKVATSEAPDFSQNGEVRMETATETKTETNTEQQQQQQQTVAPAPLFKKRFVEKDFVIRDPLTPPNANSLSSRMKVDIVPSYIRFSENFLPDEKSPGSKYQRPVKELLVHGDCDENGNFIPSSIVALSEKDAETWRNALYTVDPQGKKKAFLWDVNSQVVAAGSPIPRSILRQNSSLVQAAGLFKFFSRENSYTKEEKEALSALFSMNFDAWYKLFDKLYLKHDSAILRSDLGVIFGAAMRLYRKRHPLIKRRDKRTPSEVTCG